MRQGTRYQLTNVTLPTGKRGVIEIRGRQIGCINSGVIPGLPQVDCNGWLVVPGGIDSHVHFRTPGEEHKEDWESGSWAALAGGITTVGDMPNSLVPTVSHARFANKLALHVGKPLITHYHHFGALPDNLEEVRSVHGEPQLMSLKIAMAPTTGGLVVREDADIERHCHQAAGLGLPVSVHCEDEPLMLELERALGRSIQLTDHCQIRNREVELRAVRRALEIQRRTGCQMHFCHISVPESVQLIAEAKDQHRPVTLEVCPHHWLFSSRDMAGPDAPYRKMNPPLRSPEEAAEMRQLLMVSGLIDWVATDHAPHTRAEKENHDPALVPSGVTGVQDMMGLVYNLVLNGVISLERFIELTSANVARHYSLNKGQVMIGYDADLLLIDPSETVTIRQEDVHTRCGWSPYVGTQVAARKMVIAGGVIHRL